jgi:hypothetical protein
MEDFVDYVLVSQHHGRIVNGEPLEHSNSLAEFYVGALQPGEWYTVVTYGVTASGKRFELAKVILKR